MSAANRYWMTTHNHGMNGEKLSNYWSEKLHSTVTKPSTQFLRSADNRFALFVVHSRHNQILVSVKRSSFRLPRLLTLFLRLLSLLLLLFVVFRFLLLLFLLQNAYKCTKAKSFLGTVGVQGDDDLHFFSPQSYTAKTTRPRIRGQCIAWYARLLPSFHWYSITDPGGTAFCIGVGTQQPWQDRFELTTA